MKNDGRPNPDELLKEVQKRESRSKRGRLRVFFGMCPGVGKTYAMLRAAQEKRKAGVLVSVGVVETHDRPETVELLHGLKVIPRKQIDYRGTVLTELDIDQVLAEKPELVLVDELAHSNAPGSRHAKRYQDVEEILNHGIDVFTTLNVQHIESRAEVIEDITQVPIRETVPDTILEMANQIELVDLSPEELLKRLREGKVYMGDRAVRAAQGFFKEEHLVALRELALRFVAERVDDQLKDQLILKQVSGSWRTHEKLLVAVSHSPFSGRLIRATKRKATSLNASWIAVNIEGPEALKPEDHQMLVKNLSLARELGAEIVTVSGLGVATALTKVAIERGVSQIVIGRPDRRIWDFFTGGNILDQLIRGTSDIDIHVLRQSRKPVFRGIRLPRIRPESPFRSYMGVLGFMVAMTGVSFLSAPFVGYRAIGFVYLLGVLAVALVARPGPIFQAAILSAVAWNFFFIPPRFTFAILSPDDMAMVFVYFVVAAVLGSLTARIKRNEGDLTARQERAQVLYELTKSFSEARDATGIGLMTVQCLEKIFPGKVRIALADARGLLRRNTLEMPYAPLPEKEYAVAQWAFSNRNRAGWGTATLSSAPCLCVPLVGREQTLGVLLYYPAGKRALKPPEDNLLEQIVRNIVLALERQQFETRIRDTRVLEESEKLHQTLLNSVSHELRTPLTSIIGAATALQDEKTSASRETREALTAQLVESSERLNRLVENLLDMSRIASGVLTPKRDLFELGDFLRQSVSRLKHVTQERTVQIKEADGEIFVRGDEKLLEHAVSNVIVNAALYSGPHTAIEIETCRRGGRAVVTIRDEGQGIPDENLGRLFEKFYRLPGTPAGGTGLGLSIVKGIIEAHHGTVEAGNRLDRTGAVFTLELPVADAPEFPTAAQTEVART